MPLPISLVLARPPGAPRKIFNSKRGHSPKSLATAAIFVYFPKLS